MLRICFLVVVYGCSTFIYAQRVAVYDLAYLHQTLINPSQAGIDKRFQVCASYQKQWTGIQQSPSYSMVSLSGRIPEIKKLKKKQRKRLQNIGLGALAFTDRNGAASSTGAQMHYAWHVSMKQQQLSFGISAMLSQYVVDQTSFAPLHTNDKLITGQIYKLLFADSYFGITYRYRSFETSLAIAELFKTNNRITQEYVPNNNNRRDVFFNASYLFDTKIWQIKPICVVKLQESNHIAYEAALTVYWQYKHWAAVRYMNNQAWEVLVAAQTFRVQYGYVFEYNTSPIMRQTYGSHQVFLGYNIDLPH